MSWCKTMTELEIPFHVKCPVCMQESPTGYRISVVVEALRTFQIRLYADCHVASWDASDAELAQMRECLDAVWRENISASEDYSFSGALS
jgi:hypothetical protein